MGYGLMVTLVPLADLDRVKGSGDETLVRDARGSRCDDTVAYALGCIVDGRVDRRSEEARALASAYGYAAERLCHVLGQRLDNGPFYPTSGDALRELDEVLKARGVDLGIVNLAFGGPILGLPEPDDFPMSGAIGSARLSAAVMRPEDAPPPPHDVAWRTIAGWLARAADARSERPDGDWALVGFYY